MKKQEKELIKIINSSDLTGMKKIFYSGFITRATERENEDRRIQSIINLMDSNIHLDEVVISTDNLIIYKVISKSKFDEENPYRIIYKSDCDTSWRRCVFACSTLDTAYLSYLEEKSGNGGFAKFATKMLKGDE